MYKYFIILAIFCFSCASSKKIRKSDCEELIKLNVALIKANIDTVTIYKDTTIYVPEIKEVISFINITDTVVDTQYVNKDKIITKYITIHNIPKDSILVNNDRILIKYKTTKDSTKIEYEIKEVKIVVPKKEIIKTFKDTKECDDNTFWYKFWLGISILLIICLIILLFRILFVHLPKNENNDHFFS